MGNIHEMIDALKTRTEESLRYYAEKKDWKEPDLECAHKAAELYDKLQEIEMNEEYRGDGQSYGRHMRMPYVDGSFARGRDADTGRYISRADRHEDHYPYDDMSRDRSYARGGNHGGDRRGGRSYGDGSHAESDKMIQELEVMMDRATNDRDREKFREMIAMIEKNY